MEKAEILNRLDKSKFYQDFIPSLKINGKPEVVGLCPFHDDHNPSLSVNLESGFYICRSCGEKGDVFTFYQKIMGVNFSMALVEMAKIAGVEETQKTTLGIKKPIKVECLYPYTDEAGKILYEVARCIPKTFRQRQPDGKGGYIYNMTGVRVVPYNLPAVIASDIVYICEGEKDCDNLIKLGLVATTNPQGAGKWRDDFKQYLVGKDVVILCDNDEPGKKHGHDVARKLGVGAKSIRVIEQLPGVPLKGDVSLWLTSPGNTLEKLREVVNETHITKTETKSLAGEIEAWISATERDISVSDCDKEFGITTKQDKGNRRLIFKRLLDRNFIERVGNKEGVYRRQDKRLEIIDIYTEQGNCIEVKWPFEIERLYRALPKNIIMVAGCPDSGKTAFCLDFVRLNLAKHDICYFSSEMGAAELRDRLSKFPDTTLETWRTCNFYERSNNFADVIEPDKINIIDFLEICSDTWKVGEYLKAIHDKLKTGIAVVAIQKKIGQDLGRGAEFSLEKARLYLSMDRGKAKIIKCKNWVNTQISPVGLEIEYKLVAGCVFKTSPRGWVKGG